MRTLFEEILQGGKGDNKPTTSVNPVQLRNGIKIELEHTKDENVAKEIAMDHLAEDPEYYTKLKSAGLADELDSNDEYTNLVRNTAASLLGA